LFVQERRKAVSQRLGHGHNDPFVRVQILPAVSMFAVLVPALPRITNIRSLNSLARVTTPNYSNLTPILGVIPHHFCG
jgi:hypothetical protein